MFITMSRKPLPALWAKPYGLLSVSHSSCNSFRLIFKADTPLAQQLRRHSQVSPLSLFTDMPKICCVLFLGSNVTRKAENRREHFLNRSALYVNCNLDVVKHQAMSS